ncbi:NAD(P)-binding protein [Dendrothele bispora CBS 962.96]|uniref:NAD(P)-binding protein n=1 Tax=Dendrothele bispora (strain CBS 962.96) TaxID=1314807 RepID=A0A4S8MWD6_DENBC|nr:NAD(P)-binding protein [Dendrothele bispora CBS 962.96]
MSSKVVVCGAGFLGSHIARVLACATNPIRNVQIASRSPTKLYQKLSETVPVPERLLPPASVDITKPESLQPVFKDASVVVSLVGIMHGTPQDFEQIQWKGASNVAEAAKAAGAKLIHISAIGTDANSTIPYARTKALGEASALEHCPDATIIRPSIVFGPEDDFFNRFSKLSRYLPFLPVFGGGTASFQPVYVGDIARAIEIVARKDPEIEKIVSGQILEAGGPDILTYREVMETVLKYNNRWRPIISLPFWIGMLQGTVMERLPINLFTVTRAQVEQLKSDNVVTRVNGDAFPFKTLVEKYSGSGPLKSVHEILPQYFH